MKNLFRSNDMVMCFWQAGGGVSSWLIERGGQLWHYAILTGERGMRMHLETWALDDNRQQVDSVRHVMRLFGFVETPVFMSYESAKTAGFLANLESDINIYLADIERQKEEMKKAKEQAELDNQDKIEEKPKKDKVTPII